MTPAFTDGEDHCEIIKEVQEAGSMVGCVPQQMPKWITDSPSFKNVDTFRKTSRGTPDLSPTIRFQNRKRDLWKTLFSLDDVWKRDLIRRPNGSDVGVGV